MATSMLDGVRTLCQGCKRTGEYPKARRARPRWCRCEGIPGPYVAAPGVIVAFTFMTQEQAADRETGRLLGNEYIAARDALSLRWVQRGSKWFELPRSSPKRARLEERFAKARRALQAFQKKCTHPTRSIYCTRACDVCKLVDPPARAA